MSEKKRKRGFFERFKKSKDGEEPGPLKEVPNLLKEPWRNFERNGDWNDRYHKKLLKDIESCEISAKDVKAIRILLLGQIRAGKSSFINTLATIDKKRISQVTRSGGAGQSLTLTLKEYKPIEELKKNVCILDTMGVEEDRGGLNVKDVSHLVNGNIRPGYTFNPASSIENEKNEFFKKEPEKGDLVHCVVFVVDASILGQDNISMEAKKKIDEVREELHSHDIPVLVLLTKIDILCALVEKDVQNTYKSEQVKKVIGCAEELYKVPRQNIFPVKNYEKEMERNLDAEILVLLALRQMLYFGSDFLEHAT